MAACRANPTAPCAVISPFCSFITAKHGAACGPHETCCALLDTLFLKYEEGGRPSHQFSGEPLKLFWDKIPTGRLNTGKLLKCRYCSCPTNNRGPGGGSIACAPAAHASGTKQGAAMRPPPKQALSCWLWRLSRLSTTASKCLTAVQRANMTHANITTVVTLRSTHLAQRARAPAAHAGGVERVVAKVGAHIRHQPRRALACRVRLGSARVLQASVPYLRNALASLRQGCPNAEKSYLPDMDTLRQVLLRPGCAINHGLCDTQYLRRVMQAPTSPRQPWHLAACTSSNTIPCSKASSAVCVPA